MINLDWFLSILTGYNQSWLVMINPIPFYISRQLQLPCSKVPPSQKHWVPLGAVLHPHHPLCDSVLGLLLDGCGARAREGGPGRDHPPHHLQQVSRAQLRVSTSFLCKGEIKFRLMPWGVLNHILQTHDSVARPPFDMRANSDSGGNVQFTPKIIKGCNFILLVTEFCMQSVGTLGQPFLPPILKGGADTLLGSIDISSLINKSLMSNQWH
jgi:hypothetical protein